MLRTRGERIFGAVNNALLFVLGLIMLFPFYVTLVNSVAPPIDFATKQIILWPSKLDISAYKTILGKNSGLLDAYSITVFVTVVGTLLNVLFTVLGAAALSNKKLPYRPAITMFFVVSLYFGPGMIPAYLVNKYLGLINSIWVMIIPSLIGTMNMLYLRNFFSKIPHEIIESASMDGCSDIAMVPLILLPLSTAAIATFSLFYAVGHWNDFFNCAMYTTDIKLQNLQVYLINLLQDERNMRLNPEELAKLYEEGRRPPPTETMKAANIMAATIPIICVYPFLQKYFVKGMVVGSLKG